MIHTLFALREDSEFYVLKVYKNPITQNEILSMCDTIYCRIPDEHQVNMCLKNKYLALDDWSIIPAHDSTINTDVVHILLGMTNGKLNVFIYYYEEQPTQEQFLKLCKQSGFRMKTIDDEDWISLMGQHYLETPKYTFHYNRLKVLQNRLQYDLRR